MSNYRNSHPVPPNDRQRFLPSYERLWSYIRLHLANHQPTGPGPMAVYSGLRIYPGVHCAPLPFSFYSWYLGLAYGQLVGSEWWRLCNGWLLFCSVSNHQHHHSSLYTCWLWNLHTQLSKIFHDVYLALKTCGKFKLIFCPTYGLGNAMDANGADWTGIMSSSARLSADIMMW